MREPPEALRAARRSLDGLAGVRELSFWERLPSDTQRWALRLRVDTGLEATEFVPNPSDWYVTVDESYPLGSIHVYPAAENSITATFPHMALNGPPNGQLKFRSGHLCVTAPDAVFGRFGSAVEPLDEHARLEWHVGRTVEWVKAAANDELLREGDPYEFPVFPSADIGRQRREVVHVAFQENTRRLTEWSKCGEIFGLVPLHPVAHRQNVRAVGNFEDGGGHTLLPVSWGRAVDIRNKNAQWAAWLRLPHPPVRMPWEAPRTWAHLATICRHLGVDFDAFTDQLSRGGRHKKIDFVLAGFPIPEYVGAEPVQMAWKAARLPQPVSRKMRGVAGFRTGPSQLRSQVQLTVSGNNPINWQPTENWETQILNARGAFDQALGETRMLVIGAGAVGSKVAETLARGGCESLTIADADVLEAGNMRRHALTLSHVGQGKAHAMADRLNRVSPYMNAVAFPGALPPAGEGLARLLRNHDLVLDMTAEDSVLASLASYVDGRRREFISISTGYEARRLFFFAHKGDNFPVNDFHVAMEPWIEREGAEHSDPDGARWGVRDAPGCWHPLFPARDDALQILAGAAVRMVERFHIGELDPGLHVLELKDDPKTGVPALVSAAP